MTPTGVQKESAMRNHCYLLPWIMVIVRVSVKVIVKPE